MSDLPNVRPAAPNEPLAPGMRPALSVLDLVGVLTGLFAFITLGIWGFAAWPLPGNIAAGIGAPVVALLLWALFVSPRAVFVVHPFIRALVELLVYASATIAWWSMGHAWIGLAFAVVAVTVGLVSGRRRLA